MIGAYASGWLADRVGRRTPLMISIAGGMIEPLITTMASRSGIGLATSMLIWTVVGGASYALALFLGPETKGMELRAELALT
jgi:MFS family permease